MTGWANDINFPFGKRAVVPGFDPIVGQNGADSNEKLRAREMTGVNPADTNAAVPLLADWVVPKGGEYFFLPSIAALRDRFALP